MDNQLIQKLFLIYNLNSFCNKPERKLFLKGMVDFVKLLYFHHAKTILDNQSLFDTQRFIIKALG